MTLAQLQAAITRKVRRVGSARGLLRTLGVPEGHHTNLGLFLSGKKPPTPTLLKALGYRRVTRESYEVTR